MGIERSLFIRVDPGSNLDFFEKNLFFVFLDSLTIILEISVFINDISI